MPIGVLCACHFVCMLQMLLKRDASILDMLQTEYKALQQQRAGLLHQQAQLDKKIEANAVSMLNLHSTVAVQLVACQIKLDNQADLLKEATQRAKQVRLIFSATAYFMRSSHSPSGSLA